MHNVGHLNCTLRNKAIKVDTAIQPPNLLRKKKKKEKKNYVEYFGTKIE